MLKSFWVFSVVFAILAVVFLWLGLRGLITKRPFLFPANRLLWVTVVAFSPNIVILGEAMFVGSPHSFMIGTIVSLSMFGLILVMLWRHLRGYLIFGVTDESFQDALHGALDNLNLPYEESLSSIRLPSVSGELQVAIHPWMGTAQISMKQPHHLPLLKNIANQMTEYFAIIPAKMNLTMSIFYSLAGVGMIIMSVYMAIINRSFVYP